MSRTPKTPKTPETPETSKITKLSLPSNNSPAFSAHHADNDLAHHVPDFSFALRTPRGAAGLEEREMSDHSSSKPNTSQPNRKRKEMYDNKGPALELSKEELALRIVNSMQEARITKIFFDFDKTLLNCHSSTQFKDPDTKKKKAPRRSKSSHSRLAYSSDQDILGEAALDDGDIFAVPTVERLATPLKSLNRRSLAFGESPATLEEVDDLAVSFGSQAGVVTKPQSVAQIGKEGWKIRFADYDLLCLILKSMSEKNIKAYIASYQDVGLIAAILVQVDLLEQFEIIHGMNEKVRNKPQKIAEHAQDIPAGQRGLYFDDAIGSIESVAMQCANIICYHVHSHGGDGLNQSKWQDEILPLLKQNQLIDLQDPVKSPEKAQGSKLVDGSLTQGQQGASIL